MLLCALSGGRETGFMTREEKLLATGEVLLRRPHPDGGPGLLVVGLPDGALLVKMRSDPAKVIPSAAAGELGRVLTAWNSRDETPFGEVQDPTLQPDPTVWPASLEGPVLDE